jgi:hypothetical protein
VAGSPSILEAAGLTSHPKADDETRSDRLLAGDQAEGWPDPSEFVDRSWNAAERENVADYLRRGFVARAYMGKSRCRFCGELIGSLELSDGVFIWPEGLAHYLDVHGVRLPERFLAHVPARSEELETAEMDDDWWRAQRSVE